MVHTSWQWIVPGQLKNEDKLLNNIPPTDPESSPIYYTSTIMIEKQKGQWNYTSSFSRKLSQSQTHYIDTVSYYPKLFRSKLTLMHDSKLNMPCTVVEETETSNEPFRYHSEIILSQNQTTQFVTSAHFTPSQLQLTYIFSLKLKKSDNNHDHNSGRHRAVFWIYRR